MSRKFIPTVAAAVSVALLVAGCSSSGGGGHATSSNASSTSPSAGATSSGDPVVAAATAELTRLEKPPTSLGVPPLTSKAPRGKTVVFLSAGNTQNHLESVALQQLASDIGWTFKELQINEADASSVLNGVNQALLYHPTVVTLTGSPYSQWASAMPAYAKAGAIFVPVFSDNPPSTAASPIAIAGDALYQAMAKAMAAWVISDSKGSGHVLVAGATEFPVLKAFGSSFNSAMAQCSKCKVSTINLTASQFIGNQGPARIVSAIQRDPSIKYIIETNGSLFNGMSSALKSAGLSSAIKIGSIQGGVTNQTAIKGGQEAVTTGVPNAVSAWFVVDAALRHLEGMSYPKGYGAVPFQVLAKGGNWKLSSDFEQPSSYQNLFKQAWKVS